MKRVPPWSKAAIMKRENARGFTLIEFLGVMIMMGILTAVAVSKGTLVTQYELVAQRDILKSYLRFAQLKALHDDSGPWGFFFFDDSYQLTYNDAEAGINLPTENDNLHTLPSGITLAGPGSLNFNNLGSPGSSDITLTLSQDTESKVLVIAANTGFITTP